MAGYGHQTLDRARVLRRESTDAEQKLWTLLRSRRLVEAKWRRQQPIGPFIADFVCHGARLIVEVDGSQHSERMAADARRTRWLAGVGYRVLRFWNVEVLIEPESVLEAIYNALAATPHPNPSPSRGEGL